MFTKSLYLLCLLVTLVQSGYIPWNDTTLQTMDTIDLTDQSKHFYQQYNDIVLKNRNNVSYKYLKQVFKDGNNRIYFQDTGTYLVLNPNSKPKPLSLIEWDFNDKVEAEKLSINFPLTPLLKQADKTSTGSVSSKFSLGVSMSYESTVLLTLTLGVTDYKLEFVRSKTDSLGISTSFSNTYKCKSKGDAIAQYATVRYSRYDNLKIREINYNKKKSVFMEDDWEYLSSNFNPKIQIYCSS